MSTHGEGLHVRPARPEDSELIAALIRELAVYEKLEYECRADAGEIRRQLFGDAGAGLSARRGSGASDVSADGSGGSGPRGPVAECLIGEVDGQAQGFALFFTNFSTFLCKPGLYLEDLFVRPAVRGRGLGKALLAELARLAVQRGCGRLEWAVLDWNEPAIGFYKALGAKPMNEWTVFRLTGETLTNVAGQAPR